MARETSQVSQEIAVTKDGDLTLELQDGAQVRVVVSPNIHSSLFVDSLGSADLDVVLKEGAHLDCVCLSGDGSIVSVFDLQGQGSALDVAHVMVSGNVHDVDLRVTHNGQLTSSKISMRGVAKGNADMSSIGSVSLIGDGSVSTLTDHVLLVGDAKALAEPNMEVHTDEVRASHAGSTARIDDEQVFYLSSRGLSEAQAASLIIQGFILQVVPVSMRHKVALRFPEVFQ